MVRCESTSFKLSFDRSGLDHCQKTLTQYAGARNLYCYRKTTFTKTIHSIFKLILSCFPSCFNPILLNTSSGRASSLTCRKVRNIPSENLPPPLKDSDYCTFSDASSFDGSPFGQGVFASVALEHFLGTF